MKNWKAGKSFLACLICLIILVCSTFCGCSRQNSEVIEEAEVKTEVSVSAETTESATEQPAQEAPTETSKTNSKEPLFIPEGDDWISIGDIDEDGLDDYVKYSGEEGFLNTLELYLGAEGKVFEHVDECVVEISDQRHFVDLDHDGEKEIFFSIWPRVNSMPLEEYAVLKKTDKGWDKLEAYYSEEDGLNNSFPLKMKHGEGDFEVILSCEGFDGTVSFDVKYLYDQWKSRTDADTFDTYADEVSGYYEDFVYLTPPGTEVGSICAWGIWSVELDEFEGNPCLKAEHGVQGFSKDDIWGRVYAYFDYDEQGNIHILNIRFDPVTVQ